MTQDYKNVSYRGFRTLIAFTLLTLIASATMFHPAPVAAQGIEVCWLNVAMYGTTNSAVATGTVQCTADTEIKEFRVSVTDQTDFTRDISVATNFTARADSIYGLNASVDATPGTNYVGTAYVDLGNGAINSETECYRAGGGTC